MRLGTVLKIGGAVAIAVVVAAIAIVKSIDINQYRDVIAQQVKDATGRELVIKGELDLKISLSPSVVVRDVSFGNAAWGSRAEMVKVKQAEAEVALLPLLSNRIEVKRLILVQPDILLEKDAKGRGNWEFVEAVVADAAKPAEPAPAPTGDTPTGDSQEGGFAFKIDEVRITDARLVYADAATKDHHDVTLERLSLGAQSAASPLAVGAEGVYNGTDFAVTGTLGSLAELQAREKPFPIKLNASFGIVVAKVVGTIMDVENGKGLDLQIAADASEVAELAKMGGVELAPIGPIKISLRLTDPKDVLRLTELDVALGRKEMALVTAKGSVLKPLDGAGIDLAVTAESQDLAALSELAGSPLPALGPLRFAGQVKDVAGGYGVTGMKAELGGSDVAGDMTIRLDGTRPAIKATLTSVLFQLADVIPAETAPGTSDTAAGTQAATPEQAKPAQSKSDGRVFPNDPLPLEGLKAADLDVDIKAQRFVGQGIEAKDVALHLGLQNGKLTVSPLSASLGGGSVAGSLILDGSGKTAFLALKLDVAQIELGALLAQAGVTDMMSGGKTDLALDLKGRGISVREIMASLDGSTLVVADKATLDGAYADLAAIDVLQQVLPWTKSAKNTDMSCLVSRFSITKGKAASQAFLFDTNHMTLIGDGALDLGSERIDMTFAPQPKDASLLSLATPIDVDGTFSSPSFAPNAAGLAKGALGILGGIALGPAGILIPLVSTGASDQNPCIAALAELKKGGKPAGKSASPAQTPQSQPADPVGSLLNGIFGQ